MPSTTLPNEQTKRGAADITLDVNALLHEHATSIKGLAAPIRAILDCMGPAPFETHGEPRSDEILNAIRPLLIELRSELQRASAAKDARSDTPISLVVGRIRRLMGETNGTALSHHAKACAQEMLKHITAEDARLRTLTADIIRISTVAELLKAESHIVEIAEQTRALRDVAVAAVASPEIARTVDFMVLVHRAVDNATPYAESRRIDLKIHRKSHRSDRLLVTVQQSDVQRALSNLLSNAIKYSYTLPGKLRAWVVVDVCRAGGNACAEFENWGVPIVSEDFGHGRLFTPRYRGRYALEQGRAGTGMGLWDARATARRHGGDVTIKSALARAGETPDPASKPYITKATLEVACNH
jgi:signal transduction histidine kinase